MGTHAFVLIHQHSFFFFLIWAFLYLLNVYVHVKHSIMQKKCILKFFFSMPLPRRKFKPEDNFYHILSMSGFPLLKLIS